MRTHINFVTNYAVCAFSCLLWPAGLPLRHLSAPLKCFFFFFLSFSLSLSIIPCYSLAISLVYLSPVLLLFYIRAISVFLNFSVWPMLQLCIPRHPLRSSIQHSQWMMAYRKLTSPMYTYTDRKIE